MKKIKFSEYNSSMGILIDVQHPEDYLKKPTPGSINIYVDNLLMNYKKYLDPRKKYFIICEKGRLSGRAVAMLEYLGYNVTQVIH